MIRLGSAGGGRGIGWFHDLRVTVPAAALLLLTTSARADEVRSMVTQAAVQHGVPVALAHGIVRVESRYRCDARNPRSSATGLMQVVRGTARQVGVTGDLTDCQTGLVAGMRYLRLAYAKARGSWCGTAALYYRGIGAKPRCRHGYARKVMREASK